MTPTPVDPAAELAASRKKLAGMSTVAVWTKRLRVVLVVCVLLLGLYAWVSYRLYTLPGVHDPANKGPQAPVEGVQPGDTVLLQNLIMGREPRLGDLVIYTNPEPKDGAPSHLIGRVVGMPGETVKRAGPTMAVAGRDPLGIGFDLGDGVKIVDGDVIPDGCYMIVVDFDGLPYLDSRNLGYIARDSILRRVVLNITAWQGRPVATP